MSQDVWLRHRCGAAESGGGRGWGVGMHPGPPSGAVRTVVVSRTINGCMCVSTIVLGQPARCPFMVFNSSNQHLLLPGVRSPACKPQQTEPQQTETSSCPAECRRCSLCRAAATIFRGQCCCPGPCTALTASALPRSPIVLLMCGFLFSSWW